eukprot:Sspe_Gene.71816::Locus_42665_Transcript_1_2_Confidence_0.875_Length_2492::g.71816::m.71816
MAWSPPPWTPFLLLHLALLTPVTAHPPYGLHLPKVLLHGVTSTGRLTLTPYLAGEAWPRVMQYTFLQTSAPERAVHGVFNTTTEGGEARLEHSVEAPLPHGYGTAHFVIRITPAVPPTSDPSDGVPQEFHTTGFIVPGALSLLPPVVTVIAMIGTKQVVLSLLCGVWSGASIISDGNAAAGLLRTFDTYFVGAFTDKSHAGVLLFTFILGGTIAVVQKSGGSLGIAKKAKKLAHSPVRGQMTTFMLCCLIFFDDYSSILITGSSLRSVLSAVGVAPEKMAFIIHTLGVCFASFFPVSSWIGVQIGYLSAQYTRLGITDNAYVTCLRSIPMRYFPLLAIIYVPIAILTGRTIGCMASAEHDEQTRVVLDPIENPTPEDDPLTLHYANGGKSGDDRLNGPSRNNSFHGSDAGSSHLVGSLLQTALSGQNVNTCDGQGLNPKPDTPLRWQNAVFPFATIVIGTFLGMYIDGVQTIQSDKFTDDNRPSMSLSNAFGNCDSISALIWSSVVGWILVTVMVMGQRILNLHETFSAWMLGVQEIIDPCIVLLLAWALGSVIDDVQTASYLSQGLRQGLPAHWLPCLSMVLGALISFMCGSTFGAMGILFPIVVPITWQLADQDKAQLLNSISALFSGAVFGNTCSPIADTSVLTCMVTGCSLAQHTKTQFPIMAFVAVVSLVGGTMPVGAQVYGEAVGMAVCLALLVTGHILFARAPGEREGLLLRAIRRYRGRDEDMPLVTVSIVLSSSPSVTPSPPTRVCINWALHP